MKTYTFIVDDIKVVHVDVYLMYGFNEALSLVHKVCPTENIRCLPIIRLYWNKESKYLIRTEDIRMPFIPFGIVRMVELDYPWKEYIYG